MKLFLSCISLAGALLLAVPAARASSGDARPRGVVDLSSPEQVKRLCLATRPVERVYFPGNPVDQGREREAYKAARNADLARLYRLSVPASGFKLGDYDPVAGSLALDLSLSPRAMHGVVTLAMSSGEDIKFTVTPKQASDVMSAMKAGTATLVAYFEVSDEEGAVCSGSAAVDVFTIAATPVAFDLRDGMGQLLGQTQTPRADQFRSLIGGYSGTPTAVVGSADGQGFDALALSHRLAAITEPLKNCYVDRLQKRPDAGGTVVLGVVVGADGMVNHVIFTADGIRDQPLRECIERSVKAIHFEGVAEKHESFMFQVPVELKLVSTR